MGQIRKKLAHFRRRLQVEFFVGHTKPEFTPALPDVFLRLAHVLRILHAQQNIVGIRLLLVGVIRIVCRNGLDTVLLAKPQQHLVHHVFFFEAVAVDFRVKVFAQRILPRNKCFLSLLLAHVQDEGWDLPKQPARGDNDVLLELPDQGLVNPRHVIKPVCVGLGAELGEVVIAVFVFGEKNGWVAVVFGAAVGVVAADVKLSADNGLDARLVGSANKLKRPHHVAVVRDG